MTTDDPAPTQDSLQRLTSEQLAVLIVDARFQAGIVQKERLEHAIAIAEEEIEVRKVAGDY